MQNGSVTGPSKGTGEQLSRRLRARYLFALLLIAGLVTASSLTLHFIVSDQSYTAALVNVSGKQRTLALEALALAEQLASDINPRQKKTKAAELQEIFDLLQSRHQALLSGDPALGLPAEMSAEVHSLYFDAPHKIDFQIQAFATAMTRLLADAAQGDVKPYHNDLQYLRLVTSNRLVPAIDTLVEQYQREGEAAVERSLTFGTIVWAATLILLAVEAFFIFDPMVRRVQQMLEELRAKVTALLETRDELRELERQQKTMASNLPGIVYRSKQLRPGVSCFEHISGAVETLYGFSADEALGECERTQSVIHPDDRPGFNEALERSAAALSDLQHEYRIITRDGTERWARATAKVHRNRKGDTVWDGIVLDITDLKVTELALRQSETRLAQHVEDLEVSQRHLEQQAETLKELAQRYGEEKDRAEASEQSKAEFLASMSHEIRTPMTGIMGLADILLDSQLSADQRERVQKIKRATHSLLKILNDILDLSKLEAGKMEVELLDFCLPDLVADVHEMLYRNAEQKGLYLALQVDSELPDGLRSDPTRLRQVLVNLLGNAVKFTERGGVTLTVSRQRREGDADRLCFEVQDSGIGIADDVRDKLFLDFTQADASISRKYEGSGLGLAICKRLARLMEGEIGVKSQLGRGSTFWFWVPYREAETAVERRDHEKGGQRFQASRGLDILVAEDNQLNQEIVKSLLARYGHRLTLVDNGAAAVEAARDGEFDLILMDVRMPEMSGTDATRAIRQLEAGDRPIPIVALTADAILENQKSYLAAGMDACVAKPIDVVVLLETIDRVIGEELHRPAGPGAPDRELGAPAKDEAAATPKESGESSVQDLLARLDRMAGGLGS